MRLVVYYLFFVSSFFPICSRQFGCNFIPPAYFTENERPSSTPLRHTSCLNHHRTGSRYICSGRFDSPLSSCFPHATVRKLGVQHAVTHRTEHPSRKHNECCHIYFTNARTDWTSTIHEPTQFPTITASYSPESSRDDHLSVPTNILLHDDACPKVPSTRTTAPSVMRGYAGNLFSSRRGHFNRSEKCAPPLRFSRSQPPTPPPPQHDFRRGKALLTLGKEPSY